MSVAEQIAAADLKQHNSIPFPLWLFMGGIWLNLVQYGNQIAC